MRFRSIVAVGLLACAASPALAMLKDSPKDPPPSGPGTSATAVASATPRQEAERLYASGYEEVARAGKDLEAGKDANARKRFQRALERAERAVELDTTYHEALNLAGYAARRMGDYPRSIAHYQRCLRLKPTYAPAREYLGEAYVELGDLPKAREQLVWLERVGTPAQSQALREQIEARGRMQVAPRAGADSTANAAADSSRAGGK